MLALSKTLLLFVALATPLVGWAGEAQNAFNEGVKHHQAGRFKEAIAAYERAIKISPDASEAYNNRGLAYHNSDRSATHSRITIKQLNSILSSPTRCTTAATPF